MNCPLIVEGIDFVSASKWPVVTTRDITADLGSDFGARYEFYSGSRLLGYHDRGWITLKEGYASDGYSPVIRLFGKFIKITPVPQAGMWPALGHDFTRQFLNTPFCPWRREDTDEFFYNWLVAGGVNRDIAGTYYQAVAGPVGSAWIALTREVDPNLWIKRIDYP